MELCLSFSFFFFLHFQGLKMRPRLASLLLRRMGGVWTPVTRQPDLSALCWSTSSTAATAKDKKIKSETQTDHKLTLQNLPRGFGREKTTDFSDLFYRDGVT